MGPSWWSYAVVRLETRQQKLVICLPLAAEASNATILQRRENGGLEGSLPRNSIWINFVLNAKPGYIQNNPVCQNKTIGIK